MKTFLFSVIWILSLVYAEDDDSFSYYKFRGPVSGQVYEIVVPGYYHNQKESLDYVAKPDYQYSYGVEDPRTGTSQIHKEGRDGDAVLGEYKVLQPDGLLRIVTYRADGTNGFQANVKYVKV